MPTDPEPNPGGGRSLFVWVGLAFGLMLLAWATFFVIASKNRVAEVPLAPAVQR